jgi:catechol 2,3-dioxygenase-like lactoylglutathione lyase family enzyme
VIGTGTFTSFVENMDRSLAFYRDAFGMEVPPIPEAGARPYNRSNPQLFAMFDIPGARERHQSARVSDAKVNVELMEIQDVDHKTVPLRLQDPGNATVVLAVRDVAAALARVKDAGGTVVTKGGAAVALADGTKAVVVRDLDGRYIELRQPAIIPQANPPIAGNVLSMQIALSVRAMDETVRAYRDVLGFEVASRADFAADTAVQGLTDLAGAQTRRTVVQAPGGGMVIELVEFKGVERTPLRMRIQDRGAARLQLRAQNLDALVLRMKDAGFSVVSQGGTAVPIPPGLKGALVADPNNFFLTPFASAAPRP